MQIRSRIAPTPSGFLHLGNIFSFILTWLIVRQKEGYLLLRIDDLDIQRRRIEYLDDIFSTLEWLELDYDEGASGTADFLKKFSQETRLSDYENLLTQLIENKAYIFQCTCSRTDIQRNDGNCAGMCKNNMLLINELEKIKTNNNNAWRIEVPSTPIVFQDILKDKVKVSLAEKMGNFVVRRKDGMPAYQVSSLSDDLKYGINLIVRGEDLIDSTAAQIFLAQMLGREKFINTNFLHHALLYEKNQNRKMSKSNNSLSIKVLRENMSSPKPVFRWLASLFGFSENISNLHDLFEEFANQRKNY